MMTKIKEFFKKQILKYRKAIVGGLIVYILTRILDYVFKNFGSMFPLIKQIMLKEIKLPLYSFILSIILVIFAYQVIRYFQFKRRKFTILEANYGVDGNMIDITSELNQAVQDNKLKIVLSNEIAGDPVVGVRKLSYIKYLHRDKKFEKVFQEGDLIELP